MGFWLVSLIAFNGVAGEPSVIELKDGSIISGEVVSFDGSTWIIESTSMAASRALKMATVMPIPTARVKTTAMVKAGLLANRRVA